MVAPALAVGGPTRLDHGHVWPRIGTPTTTINFEVRYRNQDGVAPDHVSVLVDGTAHTMSATGDSWGTGETMRWSGKLPAGTHVIRFVGVDLKGSTDEDDAGIVVISVPDPTPTPDPTLKPTPTPEPTPKPTPKPTPTPTPHP